MLVVATADFELYHDLVGELRGRELTFTTVTPGEALPPDAAVVIRGEDDDVDVADLPEVVAAAGGAAAAVERALGHLRDREGPTVVGIDPGDRPGVAVVRDGLVTAAYQLPPSEVPGIVDDAIEDDPDAVVRVGDGARLRGARLIDALGDVPVELVDEAGTTPSLGTGTRGHGDVLAAVNIARRAGEPISTREVEPSPGELTAIQTASRERSPENRAIDAELAERVALGELTIDEALTIHRAR